MEERNNTSGVGILLIYLDEKKIIKTFIGQINLQIYVISLLIKLKIIHNDLCIGPLVICVYYYYL